MPFPDACPPGPNAEDIRITGPAIFAVFIRIAPRTVVCPLLRDPAMELQPVRRHGTDGPKTLDPDRIPCAPEVDHPQTG